VTGTSSAEWSFSHKIVDKQYYSASLGIAVFSFLQLFLQLLLFGYVKMFVEKIHNFLVNETKIVSWQESDWKVRFLECESDISK